MWDVLERADGQVWTEALEEWHYQPRGVAALLFQQHERDGDGNADQDLQAHLGARGEPEIAPVNHLDVVIGETDAAEGERRKHHHPYEWIREITPQQRGQQNGNADKHAAHGGRAGLLLVLLRPFLADVLADLKFAQLVDDEWPDHQPDEHGSERRKCRAEREEPEDAERPEIGEELLVQEPVEQTSSAGR